MNQKDWKFSHLVLFFKEFLIFSNGFKLIKQTYFITASVTDFSTWNLYRELRNSDSVYDRQPVTFFKGFLLLLYFHRDTSPSLSYSWRHHLIRYCLLRRRKSWISLVFTFPQLGHYWTTVGYMFGSSVVLKNTERQLFHLRSSHSLNANAR